MCGGRVGGKCVNMCTVYVSVWGGSSGGKVC